MPRYGKEVADHAAGSSLRLLTGARSQRRFLVLDGVIMHGMALTKREACEVVPAGAADPGSDPAFVAALRARRPEAYARLVELYQGQLFNLALRVVQDHDEARDVVQEVFVKALRALPATEGRLHVRAWLIRVTINASYDHLRSARRRPVPVEETCLERPASVDDIHRAELSRLFAESLQVLPERQRMALVLKDIHGLPHAEIAEALGISRGSAEVLLFRARHGFRRRFAALSDEDAVRRPCRLAERVAARSVGVGLSPARRRRLLDHARTCPDCQRTMRGWSDGAVGLAVVFPLVGMGKSTAAACGSFAAVCGAAVTPGSAAVGRLASGAKGLVGLATAGNGAGLGVDAAVGLFSLADATGAAAVGGILAKVAAMAGLKTTAAVVGGVCALAAGLAGVKMVEKRANASVGGSSTVVSVAPAPPAHALALTAGSWPATAAAWRASPATTREDPSVVATSRPEPGPTGLASASCQSPTPQGLVVYVDPVAGGSVSVLSALFLSDGQPLPDEIWAQAWLLHDAGLTWEDVADQLGLWLKPIGGSSLADVPGVEYAAHEPGAPEPAVPEPLVTDPPAAEANDPGRPPEPLAPRPDLSPASPVDPSPDDTDLATPGAGALDQSADDAVPADEAVSGVDGIGESVADAEPAKGQQPAETIVENGLEPMTPSQPDLTSAIEL